MLGGPQTLSGRGGEEKNSQPPPGIDPYNPDRPALSQSLYDRDIMNGTGSVSCTLS